MTYFPKIKISSDNTVSVDAFGRYRVSEPFTIFDNKQLHSSSIIWVENGVSGGTTTYVQNQAATILSVPAVSGSKLTRQTRQNFYY